MHSHDIVAAIRKDWQIQRELAEAFVNLAKVVEIYAKRATADSIYSSLVRDDESV